MSCQTTVLESIALRPREALISYGADRISVEDLLCIVLGSGQKKRSAQMLSKTILKKMGGVLSLSQATVSELCSIEGIGQAQATRLIASFQLGRRSLEAGFPSTAIVSGPEDIYNRLCSRLCNLDQEIFIVVALDVRGAVIDEIEVARGSLSEVSIHPREVFRPLIRRAAFACILVHNHPSGDPTPSKEDIEVGQRLAQVGTLLGIEVLDHIVIASGGYCSMAEHLHRVEVETFQECSN